MRIRHVRLSDRDDWIRMREALWPGGPPGEHEEEVDRFFAGGSAGAPDLQAVLIAEADGRAVGFLELSVREYAEDCEGTTPYIEGWFVDAEYRNRGIGGALVRAAEAWAIGRGFREIASDAVLDNAQSQAAHRALGFEEVERIVVYRKELNSRL